MTEDDEYQPDEIRSASEIATRALALFAVVGTALGAPRTDVVEWLRRESLWEALSPQEMVFLSQDSPSERELINATWRSEALLMLLWSIGLIDDLPKLNDQCDAGAFQAVLPPFAGVTAGEFVAGARRREDAELLEMADSLMNAHWEAREAKCNGRPVPERLHLGIVQERHYGINWATGYGGLPWNDVTTDT